METIMRGLMGVSTPSQEDGYLIYCPKAEDVGDRFMEEDFTWELEDDYTRDDNLGMQMVAQSLFRDGNANSCQSIIGTTELPSETASTGDQTHHEPNYQNVMERALPNYALKAELGSQYDSSHRKSFVTKHRLGQILEPHHKTGFEGQSVIKNEAIDSASSYHSQGGMTADARGIVEADAHGQTVIRIQSGNVDVGLLNTHQQGYKPPVGQLSSHIMRPTSQTPHGQVSLGLYGLAKTETATADPMQSHDNGRWIAEDAQGATAVDDKRPTWTAVPSPDVDVTCRTAVDQHSSNDSLRNTPQILHQNGQSVPDFVEGHSVAKAVTVNSTQLHDDRGGMPSDPGHGTTERTSELKPKFNEHTETCSCGTCFTPPPIYARTRVIREKPRQCPFCDKAFAYPSQLKRHMLNHTGEKLFQCPVCDKGFKQKTSLTSHMVIHTGEKHFECDVCQKAFSHRSSLQSHKRTHTGERPYQCGLCQKRFMDRRHLSRHMTLHTGERRYKCTLCTKAFSQGHNLTLHMRHHRGERNFECSTCHMKFYTNQHLTSHMRSHTGERPYRCDECGKDFSHSSSLYVHKRIHKGAKPYTCSICNKQFTQGGSLNRHMKTHTEARP